MQLTFSSLSKKKCEHVSPETQASEALSLVVSSPALLLNHVAERYSSTSRILMEFVDNSLDDAEALFDAAENAYRRPPAAGSAAASAAFVWLKGYGYTKSN